MNQTLLKKIESEQFRKDNAQFNVGDSVKVHTKVVEGDKERIQVFSGVVMGKRGAGLNETFTVRRISYGEGVERVFPLHSPRVDKIEVERHGAVRRAKLTYLRKRLGKGATLAGLDQLAFQHEPQLVLVFEDVARLDVDGVDLHCCGLGERTEFNLT